VEPNDDPSVPSPLVDRVRKLTGAFSTLFVRMNEAGDMLRIATNVSDTQGRRATLTFIPARGGDGTPSPVVSSVLRGERYVAAPSSWASGTSPGYDPIKDEKGNVIGMIFVGGARRTKRPRSRKGS